MEKLDTMPYQTPNHPAEADIPLVDPQLQGAWRARTRQAQGASDRATRMTAKELYSLVKDPGLRLRTPRDLFRLAEERNEGGDGRLLDFVLNRKDTNGYARPWANFLQAPSGRVSRRTDKPCPGASLKSSAGPVTGAPRHSPPPPPQGASSWRTPSAGRSPASAGSSPQDVRSTGG